MNDTQILQPALAFHGHKCWASTAGVRLGLAAMRELGVTVPDAKQLHAIIETGDYHGGMCFGDGIQFTTGCTFGKGNIEKSGEGKFAVTLIDKATRRAVRVAYRPTLQPRIKATPFMQKRAAGVPPTEIPDEEQMEVVHLVWDAPADEIMTVGPIAATRLERARGGRPLRRLPVVRRARRRAVRPGRGGRAVVCARLLRLPALTRRADGAQAMLLYLVGGLAVFVGSGVMAMAGLGAAFLFVPAVLLPGGARSARRPPRPSCSTR